MDGFSGSTRLRRESPPGAGRSSFELLDSGKVFRELNLKPGGIFLDMACGRGEYAIAASEAIRDEGTVYAVDLWQEGIAALREQASVKGIKSIRPVIADVSKRTPIEDQSVDVCLISTALHDFVLANTADEALREVARVLRQQGSLAILEFKKMDGPPGPPITSRLAPDEVENIVRPHGFERKRFIEVGPYNYLITFARVVSGP
jgi:ubiquinone/menaquinone biosynthesis C-methylase UbiE